MQFFKGVTRRLVIYDRPLGDAEVLELDAALRSDGSSERPGAPRNLRIVP
jgi:hypothetical protein